MCGYAAGEVPHQPQLIPVHSRWDCVDKATDTLRLKRSHNQHKAIGDLFSDCPEWRVKLELNPLGDPSGQHQLESR